MATWQVTATNAEVVQQRRSYTMPVALMLLVISVFINYVDRGNLSIAAPLLRSELGLSASQLGILLSAFFWTYSVMLFVCGWFVDRFDESVAFPCYSKILVRHLPEHRRGFANGAIIAGMKLGNFRRWTADRGLRLAQVVGIERDANSIERANVRVAEAGFHNVSFLQTDVNEISSAKPFDAAVGRFILMFLLDPLLVLKSVARLVRQGGVFAFQEPTWVPMLAMAAHLPLWSRLLGAIHKTFLSSRVNPEMGLDLYRIFQQIGLPAPKMHIDMMAGADASLIRIFSELLSSVRSLAEEHGVPLDELGDFDTLPERVQKELVFAQTVVSFVPIVSVWSRKPAGT
jgi:SAM-dependent methyltransferase